MKQFLACLAANLTVFAVGDVAFGIDPDLSEVLLVLLAWGVFSVIYNQFEPKPE